MAVTTPLLLLLVLGATLHSTSANTCYSGEAAEAKDCQDSGKITVAGVIANIFNAIKAFLIEIIPGLDAIVESLAASTGINLKETNLNGEWVKKVLGVVGFDLVHSCYIAYNKTTGDTISRGCGNGNHKEDNFGKRIVKWIKAEAKHLLAGGDFCYEDMKDEEVCLCKGANCNMDKQTVKLALNIPMDVESIQCGEGDFQMAKDCPVTDVSRVIDLDGDSAGHWKGFHAACYKNKGEEEEHCFTTEGMYDTEVVHSARLVMAGKQDQAKHVFTRFADAQPAGASSITMASLALLPCILAALF